MPAHARHSRVVGLVPLRRTGDLTAHPCPRTDQAVRSFVAVDGVDFDVARGESFGFLGPNGAGKTSTMRMIACVSPISDGTLRVLGMDPTTQGPRSARASASSRRRTRSTSS